MSAQTSKTTLTALAAAAAVALAVPGAALAAGTGGSATAPRQLAQTQTSQMKKVTEPEMQKFASAAQDVTDIVAMWRPKINAASKQGNKQQVAKLRQNLNTKLVKAVEGSGLSVQRYNEISRAARSNPKLAQKLKAHMQTQQNESTK